MEDQKRFALFLSSRPFSNTQTDCEFRCYCVTQEGLEINSYIVGECKQSEKKPRGRPKKIQEDSSSESEQVCFLSDIFLNSVFFSEDREENSWKA